MGNQPTIQLLINGENFLCAKHLDDLLRRLVDSRDKDFNFEKFSARDVTGSKLVDILNTPPMMANTRTVVVSDAQDFKKSDWESLETYLAKPNPDTHFILVCDKFDKRQSVYKVLSKVGTVVEFKSLYANQVPAFVQQEARAMGLELEGGCSDLLADKVGSDLMSVVAELEKLRLYVHPQKRVTRQHISALVTAGAVDNVFLLSNFVAQKKYDQVRKLWQKMKEQGEPVVKTVALLVNHFRKLLLTQSLMQDSRITESSALASSLGVSPYFVRDYMAQARGFSTDELKGVYQKLMTLSVAIRSTGASNEILFESFLQGVCIGL